MSDSSDVTLCLFACVGYSGKHSLFLVFFFVTEKNTPYVVTRDVRIVYYIH